jgi:hypothetical protein
MEPHDTPVDMPAVSREHAAWEQQARQLKADGYNGSVAASKLIREHGAPEEVAVALVSAVYGKNVDPRAGATTTALMMGSAWTGAGFLGLIVCWSVIGFSARAAIIYLALLGVVGKGLTQIIIAMVNSNAKEDLT